MQVVIYVLPYTFFELDKARYLGLFYSLICVSRHTRAMSTYITHMHVINTKAQFV